MYKKLLFLFLISLVLVAGVWIWVMSPEPSIASPAVTPIVSEISKPSATPSESQNWKTFTSRDRSFTFRFPSDWTIQDTTPDAGMGQFGNFIQSWVLQSFNPDTPGSGGVPENTVKVDFDITSATEDTSIEKIVTCQDKTVTCEDMEINGITYRKSVGILNSGMTNMLIGTIVDSKIYRTSVLIQSGDQQDVNRAIIEQILQSFSIQPQE